jgi:hypothetical protein
VDRVLDLVAAHQARLSRFFLGLGIVLAVYYWFLLTSTTGRPVDAQWYWSANPANLYPHPELLERSGYNYSPAFELVVGWGRLLPFGVFLAIWRAILLLALVGLAGPLTVFVLFMAPVASEINAGNIQLLLAAAIVLGFRWPVAWSFVLLTKVTPGVGLLWFALRRRWRDLALALGATVAIAAVTVVIWPDRWLDWLRFLSHGPPPAVPPYDLPLLPRLAAAVIVVIIGAWRGWRWTVIVAATLALPAFYTLSPSLLVGTLPFLRSGVGRWLADRRLTAERLPASPASLAAQGG